MSVHLYCVLPEGDVPEGLIGLEGAAVRPLLIDGVVAWVSDVPRELRVSVEGVKEHDHVVEAALATGRTPVPARFGQRFDDDRSCGEALTRRLAPIKTLIDRLQGYAEMTLLVTPSTRRMLRDLEPDGGASDRNAGPGRRYLESLRAKQAGAGSIDEFASEMLDLVAAAVASLVLR